MEFEKVHDILNDIHPLTQNAWRDFSELLEPLELKRNEYLVREGSKTDNCYLLHNGVVRVFYNQDGNEYNKTFFTAGMFPTALTALISNSPSNLSFQALLPCRLTQFSYHGFRKLFSEHRCLESLMRVILEQVWIKKERHDIRMVTNDATTNYQIFKKEYPSLENEIAQYHIASYLGITPIQLSRIRARLLKS
jgi:CRP-like cAMP-binding protein